MTTYTTTEEGFLLETTTALRYAADADGLRYEPAGTFYVDEIRYAYPTCHVRPIAEIIRPHRCHSDVCSAGARMSFSTPLSEDELDRWVHTGYVAYNGIAIDAGVLW